MYLSSHHGQGDYIPHAGIKIEPITPDGKDVKVIYDGLLAKSGAMQVYMHSGFGKRNQWQDVYDHRMEKTGRGWEKSLNMESNQLNFCFKDCAENWDNNNGENWTYVTSDSQ